MSSIKIHINYLEHEIMGQVMKAISNAVTKFPGKPIIKDGGIVLLTMLLLLLNGCHSGAIAPKGQVATAELNLIIFAVELMLLVVVPVIFMAFWFGWRYREKIRGSILQNGTTVLF